MRLTDYKVRVLDFKKGTAARVRVLVEWSDHRRSWATVGVSENVIEASWFALVDALRLELMRLSEKDPHDRAGGRGLLLGRLGRRLPRRSKKTLRLALSDIFCDRGGKSTVTLYENIFAKIPVPYEKLPACFKAIRVELSTEPLRFT